jgi:hypothetical protein
MEEKERVITIFYELIDEIVVKLDPFFVYSST